MDRSTGSFVSERRGICILSTILSVEVPVDVFPTMVLVEWAMIDPLTVNADPLSTIPPTAVGGIVESGSALTVKGSIIAHSTSTIVGNTSTGTSTLSIVERIQIPLLSLTNEPVDLSTESLVVTYIDANQVVDLESNSSAANPGTNPGWNTKFRTGDTGPLLDVGERADFWVNLSGVSVHLTASTPFTIQIKPETGIMLEIKRTTPGEITTINNLN